MAVPHLHSCGAGKRDLARLLELSKDGGSLPDWWEVEVQQFLKKGRALGLHFLLCGGAVAEGCWLTAGWLSLEPAAGEQNRSGQVAPEALEKWGWERRLERLGKEQRDS